jgi:hypothetical protein
MKLKTLLEQHLNENVSKSVWPYGSYEVGNSIGDKNTQAKRFTFSLKIDHTGSSLHNKTINDSFVLAFSTDSRGIFSIGNDIEKYTGVSEQDANDYVAQGKELPSDALIMGMCNIMNGGKDIYFWNNGMRIKGSVDIMGLWPAIIEQISHEAGVHLTRLILTRYHLKMKGISIDTGEWIDTEWPAIGDLDDNTPIVGIDEETFATVNSGIVSMITPTFLKMAARYVPELRKI